MRPLHLGPLALSAMLAVGCDRAAPQYEHVDRPPPAPVEVDAAPPAKSNDHDQTEVEEKASACGRGTGRDASGRCKWLNTRDIAYVERVQIPSGTFVMGDVPIVYDAGPARTDPQVQWSGQPPRRVDMHSFWIDLHEVTRGAYTACVNAGACQPAECPEGEVHEPGLEFSGKAAANIPQTCVTHAQAQAFCAAHQGRLPTEAEWEYAARGVDARTYPWGSRINDQYTTALTPVTGPTDGSYFGVRGMGSNATEWVADAYEPEQALASFLTGAFRKPNGPLRRAQAGVPAMHVVKGGRAGARTPAVGSALERGFRCAADLEPDDEVLTVPAEPPDVPLVYPAGELQVFGGVAEAVDRQEASRFCKALRVEHDGTTFARWRLPTLAEVQAIEHAFRGPGPFWAADTAMVQAAKGDPWTAAAAGDGDALAARCVHE